MNHMKSFSERDFYHLAEFDPDFSSGKYQMPSLKKESYVPQRLIDFNVAIRSKDFKVGVHFYLDDYRFERFWKEPYRYLKILNHFDCVFTPDFSLYLDMPMAMKIWNIYRSRLLGKMMQKVGLKVIPTISWTEPQTYEFCFDGIEPGGVVTVSTVGIMRNSEAQKTFEHGFGAMFEHLAPSEIIIYGHSPHFIQQFKIKIHTFPNTSLTWKNGIRNVSYKEAI